MLRAGLLEGTVVATAGGAEHVAAACAALGARTVALEAELLDEQAVTAAAVALGAVGTLVCDAAPAFVTAGERQRGGKGSLVAQHPQWWIADGSSCAEIAQARVREGIPA